MFFSKFYDDLNSGEIDILQDCLVTYGHIEVPKPSTGRESCLLDQICVHLRNTMLIHHGREYDFGNLNKPVRATQPHLLNPKDINQLPTNNTLSKRMFSVFDHKTVSTKCCNYKF